MNIETFIVLYMGWGIASLSLIFSLILWTWCYILCRRNTSLAVIKGAILLRLSSVCPSYSCYKLFTTVHCSLKPIFWPVWSWNCAIWRSEAHDILYIQSFYALHCCLLWISEDWVCHFIWAHDDAQFPVLTKLFVKLQCFKTCYGGSSTIPDGYGLY